MPTVSVNSALAVSRSERPTKPTAVAVIGSRSGLTAIAPTIRIGLASTTP